MQAGQGALAGKNRMFSEDIGPLIDRVNWNYAENAYATLWNDRYYLALPVDQAEVMGPELGYVSISISVTTVAGRKYKWTQAVGGSTRLTNGSETRDASGTIIAQGTTVTITFIGFVPPSAVITDSLSEVFAGQNTALAHFDFQNAAWGGYDEAAGISFKQVFTSVYLNRQRLFVMTHDGFVRLWEEGYADRLSAPYVTVVVSAQPANGNTLIVNSGTTVTAGGNWTVSGGVQASMNQMWYFEGGPFGYNPAYGPTWTAPNTRKSATTAVAGLATTTSSVSFYSTNGVPPVVVTTGSWATVTPVVEQAITTTFVTRAYVSPYVDLARFRHLLLDVQTWKPSFTVTLLSGGAFEETAVASAVTKSRTAYYKPAGTAAYNRLNPNNDFDTPYREDYSIAPLDASFTFTPGDAVRGNHHQQTREAYRLNAVRDRAVRVKIVNTQGRLRLLAVQLQSTVQATPTGSFPT